MSFLPSMNISASGITAQMRRMNTITENIVNRETTRTEAGGSYRRQLTVFQEISANRFRGELRNASSRLTNRWPGTRGGVMVREIVEDPSDFIPVFDPNHPDANEEGYVMMPNVNNTIEMIDAMAATRSYNANISAFEAIRQMAQQALEIGR